MLTKVISGGQTGADQGGLRAAKAFGIETGGTAPPRFMTDAGPNIDLKRLYGLEEVGDPEDSAIYRQRTIKNATNSDGTVWFGSVDSPGAILTLKSCISIDRPWIVNPTGRTLAKWIQEKRIKVLNVAGNRERTNKGIGDLVESILKEALDELENEDVTQIVRQEGYHV